MKVNHHKPIICELKPIRGSFLPEVTLNELLSPKRSKYLTRIPNKGYRNLAYYLNTFITNSGQTIIDTGGTSRTLYPIRAVHPGYDNRNPIEKAFRYYLNLGSSTSPHDITRYELYSRHFGKGGGGIGWLVEEASQTKIVTYHRYAFPAPSKAVGEAGLYLRFAGYCYDGTSLLDVSFLLARAIIDPVVEKPALTLHEEGWEIVFPANYAKWFLDVLMNSCFGVDSAVGQLVRAADGGWYVIRQHSPWAGSPDVMIGSDNSPPSPTGHHLKAPIASLSSQTQGVEIDTVLQECRIVRTGTYTPSTVVTLGEVAMYTYLVDTGGAGRKVMIARGTWDPPLTLEPGATYTIGIALRLG